MSGNAKKCPRRKPQQGNCIFFSIFLLALFYTHIIPHISETVNRRFCKIMSRFVDDAKNLSNRTEKTGRGLIPCRLISFFGECTRISCAVDCELDILRLFLRFRRFRRLAVAIQSFGFDLALVVDITDILIDRLRESCGLCRVRLPYAPVYVGFDTSHCASQIE